MTRSFSSLRSRLMTLILLAIVPAFCLVIYTASEQRALAAAHAEESALRIAKAAASSQAQLIEAARQLLMALAELPDVQDKDPAVCGALLAHLLNRYPLYVSFGVANRDGQVICSSKPSGLNANIGRDSLVQMVFDTRNFAVGDYRISPSGKAVLGFGYPLFEEDGRVARMLFTSIDLDWFNDFVAQSLMPAGSTLTVTDRHGIIVARIPEPHVWIGRSLADTPLARIVTGSEVEGTFQDRGEDNVPRLYAFTALQQGQESHVHISVGIPAAVAFADVNQMLARNLIALGLVAILTLATAWFGGELFLLRQVRAFLSATKRLADGDLTARTGVRYGVSDLMQLAQAFDRMVDALQQREVERNRAQEEMVRQAARAESLVNTARQLNAELDLKHVAAAVCEGTARALGVPAVAVSLYDEGADLPFYATQYGLPEESLGYTQSICQRSRERLMAHRDAAVVMPEGGELDPRGDDPPRVCPVYLIAAARMEREGSLIGILCLYAFDQSCGLADDDLILLKGLTVQAALAIANAYLYETVQQEQRARAGLLRQVITAQEDERKRIARELHDETSQSVVTLMVGLDHALMLLGDGSRKAAASLRTAKFIAEGLLGDIHRLIEDLRPALLDVLGLDSAIISYGEQRLRPAGITLRFDREGPNDRLTASMEIALFRMVQEALTNVLRHAHASEACVRLIRKQDCLTLDVTDNGCGFDPALLAEAQGFGLCGIQERVSILGGEFHMETAPGAGTRLRMRVPVSDKEVAHDDSRATSR